MDELVLEAPERRLFLAKELTKKYQTYLHGTASEIKEQFSGQIKGERVVVIEAGEAHHSTMSERDILAFDLPKKVASKLIAKITGESPKAWYQRMLKQEK